MFADRVQKVTAEHLKRDAFLYVRQSSLRQVLENTESTDALSCGFRGRAGRMTVL